MLQAHRLVYWTFHPTDQTHEVDHIDASAHNWLSNPQALKHDHQAKTMSDNPGCIR
jgi:hypothetical protein